MSPTRSCATSVCSFKHKTSDMTDLSLTKLGRVMHLATAVRHLVSHWYVRGEITVQNKVTYLLPNGPDGDIWGTFFSGFFIKDGIISFHRLRHANILILFVNMAARWDIRNIKPCVKSCKGRPRCKLTTRIGFGPLRYCQENSGFVGSVVASSQQGHRNGLLFFCHYTFAGQLIFLSSLLFTPPYY